MEAIAVREQPKLIIGGGSRLSPHHRLCPHAPDRRQGRRLYLVDMAHFAGLVAGGVHPSPVPHAHIVTTTTHKTLRGPRSGMILCKQEFAAAIDKSVFPGCQGGPLVHVVAAKAVCFREALQPSFKEYAAQIVANAKVLAQSSPTTATASSPAAPTRTSCWSMSSARACSAARPRRLWAWPASRSTRTPSPLT